jgi:hypothetical protein
MGKQGYGVIYAPPDDFAKFMAKSDADLGATMKAGRHCEMTQLRRWRRALRSSRRRKRAPAVRLIAA